MLTWFLNRLVTKPEEQMELHLNANSHNSAIQGAIMRRYWECAEEKKKDPWYISISSLVWILIYL